MPFQTCVEECRDSSASKPRDCKGSYTTRLQIQSAHCTLRHADLFFRGRQLFCWYTDSQWPSSLQNQCFAKMCMFEDGSPPRSECWCLLVPGCGPHTSGTRHIQTLPCNAQVQPTATTTPEAGALGCCCSLPTGPWSLTPASGMI